MFSFANAALRGIAVLAVASLAGWPAAATAQTTMTMSSWVSPSHLLTVSRRSTCFEVLPCSAS